ncbi:hypothetical protein FOZ60_015344 [Perkinsus olseni]|uniref:Uncharacterized protein n=1 Tax=Perkinsus olseni TaxID=32597 RepID=A0A7J6N8I6_PEROL|nr:hypothetical protein FOZ60_015344 [Perkinsus olseni]
MSSTVDNPIQDPELRSLRMPVVTESPPGCLPPGKGFQGENHCWYVLKGPHQYNGGAFLASNNSEYTGFATMELGIILASNSSPVDVGVWANGETMWLFNLPAGISVGVELSIPTFLKVGGYDYLTGKWLDFPIFLRTNTTVPNSGTVQAVGNGTAHAFVDARDKATGKCPSGRDSWPPDLDSNFLRGHQAVRYDSRTLDIQRLRFFEHIRWG